MRKVEIVIGWERLREKSLPGHALVRGSRFFRAALLSVDLDLKYINSYKDMIT